MGIMIPALGNDPLIPRLELNVQARPASYIVVERKADMQMNSMLLTHELVSGERAVDPDLIDALIRWQLREDVHLDYKSGDWLGDDGGRRRKSLKSPKDRLLAYVSGFANADGGVLVVGIVGKDAASPEHPAWSVKGVADRGIDLSIWVSDMLRPHAGYFTSQPRVGVVRFKGELVLVIAVARSATLVPMVVDGKAAHYLRVGDGTSLVPEYLHADLILGRRQRPKLRLSFTDRPVSFAFGPETMTVVLWLQVFNESLAWANHPAVGWVYPSAKLRHDRGMGQHLRECVDVSGLSSGISIGHAAYPLDIPGTVLGPGGNGPDRFRCQVEVPSITEFRFDAAVYVASIESMPSWYQLSAVFSDRRMELRLTPATSSRPRVGLWVTAAYGLLGRMSLEGVRSMEYSEPMVDGESEVCVASWTSG